MTSSVMNPPIEILPGPKQLVPGGCLSQQVTPLVPVYSNVTSDDLALCSLILPLKTIGIAVSHQCLCHLSNFDTETYIYPLFSMEQSLT